MIRSAAGTGLMILSEGELAGAYSSESPAISDKPDRALALCEDPNAMIEVKSADTSTHTPLDIDDVVAGQRGPRMNPQVAQTAPPAPAPPPPAPPVEPATSQIPLMAQTAPYPAMQREAPTPPSMPAMPMAQVTPTAPPPSSGPQLDLAALVAELQAMAEDQLGNRARKVKDILGAADPPIAGIQAAIDQVPRLSLLFVDSSRLEQLAQEMRARLKSHY